MQTRRPLLWSGNQRQSAADLPMGFQGDLSKGYRQGGRRCRRKEWLRVASRRLTGIMAGHQCDSVHWEHPEHTCQVRVDTTQDECGAETEMGKQDWRRQSMKAISLRDDGKMDMEGWAEEQRIC